jgi:type IV secretion system protein TrbE
MLRLDKVIKPWKESAALNDHINLYGFWSETAFLTKSGDLGMVLRISGVDYESLDHSEQEYAVKRLESAESIWPRLSRLPVPLQIKPPGHPVRKV